MKPLKSLNVKECITALKVLDNGHFSIMDTNTSVRICDLNDYKVVGGFKSNITQERHSGHIMCTSKDGRFCAAIVPNSNKAALFSVAKKGLLYKVGRHQGKVESLCIDPKSRYIVTGGEDGKTFVWTLKNARLAFSLPPHSDFVTALAFSDNGQYLASGSFDRTIHVQNIATMKTLKPLRAHASVVTQIIFLNQQRLISADKEGGLIVWDISTSKVIKRLSKVPDDITSMTVSDDFKFLFVGTKLGYIVLYDLNSYELLSQRYLKVSAQAQDLAFIQKGYRFAVGTAEGVVSFYSLFGDEARFKSYLENNDFKTLYEAVENNPILLYSDIYTEAEKRWNTTLSQAKKLLQNHDKKGASTLLSLFSGIPKKNTIIQSVLKDFEYYAQFEKAIVEGRYPLVYSMVLKYPSFKDLEKFKALEKQFQKLLIKAQGLLSKSGGEMMARELLAPFRGVSEKTQLIQQLFSEHKTLTYLKQLIGKKEFKKAYILVEQHEFLKAFPEYATLEDLGDKIYIQAHKSYASNAYKNALNFAQMLLAFPMFSEDAQLLIDEINAKQHFYSALHEGDEAKAFKLMSTYPILYETSEGEALEMGWNEDVEIAMNAASKGDIATVSSQLEKYFTVEAKFIALATVYQQAYIEQLTQLIRDKAQQDIIENGIRHYIRDFGLNEFIAQFFDSFSARYDSNLDIQAQVTGDIVLWKPSMIVPLIYK